MVASRETPMARAKRNTTLSSSPAARAPAPLGASAAPRCTDAAVDVPEKEIPASPAMALWSMKGQGKQGARRSKIRSCRGAGRWRDFYRPSVPHWPLRRSSGCSNQGEFCKKPFSFTPIQLEGQATARVRVFRHLKINKGAYFLQGRVGPYASKEHRCTAKGATSRSTWARPP